MYGLAVPNVMQLCIENVHNTGTSNLKPTKQMWYKCVSCTTSSDQLYSQRNKKKRQTVIVHESSRLCTQKQKK